MEFIIFSRKFAQNATKTTTTKTLSSETSTSPALRTLAHGTKLSTQAKSKIIAATIAVIQPYAVATYFRAKIKKI